MPFKITILGSSGAVPAYGRMPTSQFIEVKNHYILIDCGEGSQMQMMKYGLPLHRIDYVFISHLHGDHYLGLMGLLFTLHLNRRTADLHLYSHTGLDEIIIAHLRHSKSALNFKIIFHVLTPSKREIILETKHLTVETIPLSHNKLLWIFNSRKTNFSAKWAMAYSLLGFILLAGFGHLLPCRSAMGR